MLGNTPMMMQYQGIKKDYVDCILFYRLGDFYEMFGPDAEEASKILDIALTGREGGLGKIPMCGIPFHSAENYIAKLIEAGKKVAICEQVEDPKAVKGIVKREVIRVITPGTVLESNLLKEGDNNYLVCIAREKDQYGFAAIDASTGEFVATEIPDEASLMSELWRFDPVECIISSDDDELVGLLEQLIGNRHLVLNRHLDYAYKREFAEQTLLEHFKINSLVSFDAQDKPLVIKASGAILDYLQLMQKVKPANVTNLTVYRLDDKMHLDYSTKRNLELVKSLHGDDKKDSLISILDYTVTSLGSRMLKNWVEKPLIRENEIEMRLDANEEIINDTQLRNNLKTHLEPIYDLERIVARISFGSANAKDLLALKNSLRLLPNVEHSLTNVSCELLSSIRDNFDCLDDLYDLLERGIHDDAPFSVREGNLIKDQYNEEIDQLREVAKNGKQWIIALEGKEREKTGIKSLKVNYNKVFGYYVEVTKSNLDLVPEHYIRKQTLANCERFITSELKELEAQVLGADDRLKQLEYELFIQIRTEVQQYIPRVLSVAKLVAQLDCLYSLAQSAIFNNLTRPFITHDGSFVLKECRHPVVEKKLKDQWYVPNDIALNKDEQRFLIITGPNMAGKSTYCRSIAIASILMQVGSFVPAMEAHLPIVDRVFARIGASDDLSTGQSTFMVEMNEVANIINNATADSLIILDEVGRGTSTYDGLSIAWALTKYINDRIKAKTLFATHYHELTELENEVGIKNYSVAVKEDGDHVVFLRKIIPGGADKSYGIHVAQLAGLPSELIDMAKEVLRGLEASETQEVSQIKTVNDEVKHIGEAAIVKEMEQISLFSNREIMESETLNELTNLDLINITPLQAIGILYQLQTKAKSEISR